MKKMHCLLVFVIAMCAPSCQKRTVCRSKTANGGTHYTRLYENTYNSSESYQDAIQALKDAGYTCDDSVPVFVQ